jgi:antitoxin (DNA-binding transcriptional repressor) of toxin-antitoxin stability system
MGIGSMEGVELKPPQTLKPADSLAWVQEQQSQAKEIISCCQAAPRQALPVVSQRKCQLAPRCIARHLSCMKTASVQQLPQQWPEILRWVAAGEEVQVTQQDEVIAKVVPARPAPRPDFLARAKAIWGEQPPGKPLSELVLEARGGEP